MKRVLMNIIPLVLLCVGAENLGAQSTGQGSGTSEIRGPTAVSYLVNGGKTKIDRQGTGVIPDAKGEAKVEAKEGATFVEAKVEHLHQPQGRARLYRKSPDVVREGLRDRWHTHTSAPVLNPVVVPPNQFLRSLNPGRTLSLFSSSGTKWLRYA